MEEIIFDEDKKGFTVAFTYDDIERINPIEYYKKRFVERNITLSRIMFTKRYPWFPEFILEKVLLNDAEKDWKEHYEKIMKVEVPTFLLSALKADNKKYQEKFLRGMEYTPAQFEAFIFRAFLEHGFTLSIYSTEHLPNGTDEKNVPRLIHAQDGEIHKVGETSLSDGELKQIVEQRSAIYGKILDKGDIWHCFFITIESIAGKENWKDGQPHFHYISDKFGISRDEVVKQLKSKDYKLFNLPHIELKGYGVQPNNP